MRIDEYRERRRHSSRPIAIASTSGEIFSDYVGILTSAAGQTVACAATAGVQALLEIPLRVLPALTGIGVALDLGSAAASGSDLIQLAYELGQEATAVETSVISILPGATAPGNIIPSITALSPTSIVAGSSAQNVTINGQNFVSNSTVAFNGSLRSDTFTDTNHLTISLSAADLATAGSFPVVVTNPYSGGSNQSNAVNLVVQPPVALTLMSLSLSQTSVTGGTAVMGTITLSNAAPLGGATVNLSSSNTAAAQVPASITVAAGQTIATFTITTPSVASTQTATITASFGASPQTAVLTISPSAPLQTITEYPIPTSSSSPRAIVTGSDGALWFTEFYGLKIGRITTTGVITEYPVPTNSVGITAGPDGALWFAEFIGRIGRITTSGVVTEYPVPTSASGVLGIAAGPDGALWFAESDADKIGRITTNGVITEYPVPTPNSVPQWITTGPDGALWFTELNGNKIGRATTSGVITEYPIPTANSQPGGITVGPDGAVWFTEGDADKIGRITTSGVITEYSAALPGVAASGITAGPDGALWFGGTGRISTSGILSAYPGPAPSNVAFATTAGPDGAVWFAEIAANQIGRAGINPSNIITPAIQGVWVSSTAVTSGSALTATATLTGPAPPGGLQIAVLSSNPSAQVPASITVAAGQTSATFAITTTIVTSVQSVTITASLGASTVTATLSVSPPSSSGPPSIYSIVGTMNIAGKTVSMNIQVASNFVTLDDSNSFTTGLDIEVGMFTSVNVSGSTVSYTSTSISDSLYRISRTT